MKVFINSGLNAECIAGIVRIRAKRLYFTSDSVYRLLQSTYNVLRDVITSTPKAKQLWLVEEYQFYVKKEVCKKSFLSIHVTAMTYRRVVIGTTKTSFCSSSIISRNASGQRMISLFIIKRYLYL